MDITEARATVAKYLGMHDLPLQLTFHGENAKACGEFIVIGDDYGTQLCVRLSDGSVYSIDPRGELPERFVNSSIQQFAGCIEVFKSYERGPADVPQIGQKLQDDLSQIDRLAVADPKNWWACIVEQVSNGMMSLLRQARIKFASYT
jgi:hypothetical protein